MNQRDLELLSSYLDGQLKPSDSARLEARLASDRNLRSVLDDLRAARGLLRQLPLRKAPRNFTLTPQMVGKNPPLPRTYPAFKFVTALATLLFFATMGANFLVPQMASQPSAFGMGGGGAPDVYSAQAPAATEAPMMAAATEMPAATEAPATEAAAEPATGEAVVGTAPMPTTTPALESASAATVAPAQDTARALGTPMEKAAAPEEFAPPQPQVGNGFETQKAQPPVPAIWVVALAGIALLGAVVMLLMRRMAAERWQGK
ncbi:MAG: hypothetical protein ACM33V_06360 [Chloroflexota bacterium]